LGLVINGKLTILIGVKMSPFAWNLNSCHFWW
jgi:hypothetical protein